MYSIWIVDLEQAINVIKKKLPNVYLLESIETNAYGDFIVKTAMNKYLIKKNDFSIYQREGDWKNGKWVKL